MPFRFKLEEKALIFCCLLWNKFNLSSFLWIWDGFSYPGGLFQSCVTNFPAMRLYKMHNLLFCSTTRLGKKTWDHWQAAGTRRLDRDLQIIYTFNTYFTLLRAWYLTVLDLTGHLDSALCSSYHSWKCDICLPGATLLPYPLTASSSWMKEILIFISQWCQHCMIM